MIIDKWKWYMITRNKNTPEEIKCPLLYGKINGKTIILFTIKFNILTKCLVDSDGKEYSLGDPHPDYEKRFPNAKTTFLKCLEIKSNKNVTT